MELNKFLDNLKKAGSYAILKPERKEVLKSELLAKIELMPEAEVAVPASFSFSFMRPVPVFAGIALLVLVGGSISFASENSLPGDILYPIKINFNEEIVGALSFTPATKADWEAKRAERRMEEMSRLALANPTVSEEKKDELEKQFENHAAKAEAGIKKLESQGRVRKASEVASNMETSLRARENILRSLNAPAPMSAMSALSATAATDTLPLEQKLSEKISDIEATRAGLEMKIASDDKDDNDPSSQEKISEAEKAILAAKALLKENQASLSDDTQKDINDKITDADEMLSEAKSKLAEKNLGGAFNLGSAALRKAQEVKLIIEGKLDLDLSQAETEPQPAKLLP